MMRLSDITPLHAHRWRARSSAWRPIQKAALITICCLLNWHAIPLLAQGGTGLWSAPAQPSPTASHARLHLHLLNSTDQAESMVFPKVIACRLIASGQAHDALLHRIEPNSDEAVDVRPGGFARGQYELLLPTDRRGSLLVRMDDPWPGQVTLLLGPVDTLSEPAPPSSDLEEASPLPSDPVAFFKEHFFPYEPMYFIAGFESPHAKIQISLKYRIFTTQNPLCRTIPPLQDLYLAYTQTSLWDWDKPSAPFFDSSYKPEILYAREWVRRDQWASWFRLEFQTGFQHESNGRDGNSSRSLNIAYVRPTFAFGQTNGLQLILMPRAWFYVGDLSDNPDLADYRGYVDLRAVLGWNQGLQLSALVRAGRGFDQGSIQLDATYPLWKIPLLRSSLFVQLQYFNGYGESLLLYNERSSIFRLGFALFR